MNIKAELAALEKMSTRELVERYAALTGQPVRTGHRAYLIRKIAWRLQADAEGDLPSRAVAASAGVGLSGRARRRAAELADDADVRLMPPRRTPEAAEGGPSCVAPVSQADPRLPAPGAAITRAYKGRTLQVVVSGSQGRPDYSQGQQAVMRGQNFPAPTPTVPHSGPG